MDTINLIILCSHVFIGSMAFVGGLIALASKKGSSLHIQSGGFFAFGMTLAVVTSILMMILTKRILPLAIVLSLGTLYFIGTAILAFRNHKRYAYTLHRVMMILPVIGFIFSAVRLINLLPQISILIVGPLLMSILFVGCLIGDFNMLRLQPIQKSFWVRRHLVRMIFAFGFAVMAILRIAVKLEFFKLEWSVIAPLILSMIAAFLVDRKYPSAA